MGIQLKGKILIASLLCAAAVATYTGCTSEVGGTPKDANRDKPVATNQAKPQEPNTNSEQPATGEVQIVIENFVFVPSEVTITAGTKVTWINKDEAPHTATSVDKKFNSGGMDTDDKFSFVFNDKGDYAYFCALHPHMKATITVK